jgi:pyruvate dehydrogenase E1 component alpha subunit
MRDGSYRTPEEVESWKNRDPIQLLHKTLTTEGLASADELSGIDTEVQALIAEGFEFAKNSPYPDGATASDYIYSS